jgi:hypothetical protein
VTLTNTVRDEIIPADALPIKMTRIHHASVLKQAAMAVIHAA